MCPRNRKGSGFHGFMWQGDHMNRYDDPWGLTQAFHVLDRDGDGAIKSADLSAFFGGCVGESISTEEATSMIALADLDGDGAVGLDEFQQLMVGGDAAQMRKRRQQAEEATLREVFGVLDVNKDGKLGREDLRTAMALSGHSLSEEELDAMVGAATGLPAPGMGGASTASINFDAFFKLMTFFNCEMGWGF